MKFWKSGALLLLISGYAFSQTLINRSFLMRAETTTADPYSGTSHMCMLVYPDGRYRLEKSFQGNNGVKAPERVYVDTLTPDEVKQLQAILDDSKFSEIKTGPMKGGIVQDMDQLMVSVPREHQLQNIGFMTAAERKPYEKELKPFFNWMKEVQKRKVQPAKNEPGNNCSAPQVMYRTEKSAGL